MFVLAYLAAYRTVRSQALLLSCPVQLRLYSLTLKGDLFPGWPGAGWAWLSARQARFHVINNQLRAQCVILVKIQALEQLPNRTATTSTNLFCISLAFENVNWLIISIHIQGRKLIKAGRCRISRHICSGVVCPGSLLELLEYLGSNSQENREWALGRGVPCRIHPLTHHNAALSLIRTFPARVPAEKEFCLSACAWTKPLQRTARLSANCSLVAFLRLGHAAKILPQTPSGSMSLAKFHPALVWRHRYVQDNSSASM